MPNTSNPVQNSPRQVFRQRGALIGGGFVIAMLTIVAVASLFTDDTDGRWQPLLWCVAFILIMWVLLIRPSVAMDQRGLYVNNLVRNVFMPWARVDVVESRWNLKVFTPEDDGYAAWAISAQRPKGARPGGGGPLPGFGRIAPPTASGADPGAVSFSQRPGSAGDVATKVRAAREDYDRAVSGGLVEPSSGPVVVRPAVLPIAALVGAAALIALAVWT